ncbi:MAG: DMT family transporter [Desulfobacterales bacterium]|jgi:drug/metabolite transporter (DMT)-like permease|nr:DMT family transporter [Desulfobacterales bacterium]
MQTEKRALNPHRGYAYVILAALLWGVSGSSAKFLFNSGVTPYQVVQLRLTLAAVILLGWLAIRNPALLRIARRDIWYFALFGTVGMGACQFTYLFAISKIKVAAAILLQYLAPSFIAVHAVVFARDRLSASTVLALAGATIGCYLVVGAYDLQLLSLNLVGVLSGILSAVTFAWYSIHGEYGMRRYNPWTVLFYALLFAALVWNILHPPLEAFFHRYSAVEWGWVLYIGILGTLLPFGLYLEGVNLIRSTRASITAILEPITAGVVSYVFLKETMAPLQIAGGLLVIGSIVLLQLKQEKDEKAPALIRARREG